MSPNEVKVMEGLTTGDSTTIKRLEAVRASMGTKAAIDSKSEFKVPPGVGSHFLTVWRAQRILARAGKNGQDQSLWEGDSSVRKWPKVGRGRSHE